MTTIAFQSWDTSLKKTEFADVFEFIEYVAKNCTRTSISPLPENEVTAEMILKMNKAKHSSSQDFVNI